MSLKAFRFKSSSPTVLLSLGVPGIYRSFLTWFKNDLLPEKASCKVDPRNTKASWRCFIFERQKEINPGLLRIDSYSFEAWFDKSCFIVTKKAQLLMWWMHATNIAMVFVLIFIFMHLFWIHSQLRLAIYLNIFSTYCCLWSDLNLSLTKKKSLNVFCLYWKMCTSLCYLSQNAKKGFKKSKK